MNPKSKTKYIAKRADGFYFSKLYFSARANVFTKDKSRALRMTNKNILSDLVHKFCLNEYSIIEC